MSNPAVYRLQPSELDSMLKQLQSHNVPGKPVYLRMGWSDLHGIVRGVTIPFRHAQSFLTNGHSAFAGSICFSVASEASEDIFMGLCERNGMDNCLYVPGLNRLFEISWLDDTKGRTFEVICNAVWPDGTPYCVLPRNVLLRQLHRLNNMGYTLKSAFESEFMLLHSDTLQPIQQGLDYSSFYNINNEIAWLYDLEQKLFANGINIRHIHKENMQGQYEVTFMPEEGVMTSDNLSIYKQALKAVAKNNYYTATFMSQFIKEGGNGFHFNHSLWKADPELIQSQPNLFWDDSKPDKISDVGRFWLGGLLKHLPALTAISCPTINCYRRMHTPVVPTRPNWGVDNRMMAIRVINLGQDAMRFENRLPSGAGNPYLITAACIAAGIDGIENQIEPPQAGPYSEAPDLPHTLEEALMQLESDDVLVNALGREFVDLFLQTKRKLEVAKFGHHNMKEFKVEEVDLEKKQYLEFV